MATFTLPLKKVLKATHADGKPVGSTIGLGVYPIFDEAYRAGLNTKIIEHYWNREIGLETIDMFQFAVRRRMNEIMPFYNQMYLSAQLPLDPFKTVDIKTVNVGESKSTNEAENDSVSESENLSNSRSVASETPQTMLAGNEDYATSAADANSTGKVNSTGSETGKTTSEAEQESTSEMSGYQGVPAELLMRYRDSIINVDMMVITSLEDCFMGIYDNGDEYTRGGVTYYDFD